MSPVGNTSNVLVYQDKKHAHASEMNPNRFKHTFDPSDRISEGRDTPDVISPPNEDNNDNKT